MNITKGLYKIRKTNNIWFLLEFTSINKTKMEKPTIDYNF